MSRHFIPFETIRGGRGTVNFHRFGLGDAGGPIDSRVGDLCNHVGFPDVAAPREAAGGCLNKKSCYMYTIRG
jgi:hypothetical protein